MTFDLIKRYLPALTGSLLVACLVIASPANAQTAGEILRDIKKAKLLIEDLDEDALACGLTRDALRQAFMFPASSTQLRFEDAYRIPVVYIRVITARSRQQGSPDICASSVRLEVFSTQMVLVEASDRSIITSITLWSRDTVGFSASAQHARQITSQIESLTKRFLTDWNLDNKK